MSAQSGAFHWKLLLPRAVYGRLDGGRIGGTPVEVRHAEADFGSYVAVGLVVVRDRPDLLAGGLHLLGLHQGFRGVDAGHDYVIAAIEEVVRDLGRVGGHTRDVEPEADPGDLEGQLGRIVVQDVGPAVLRAQVGRGGQAAGFIVDQRAKIADLAGLGSSGRPQQPPIIFMYSMRPMMSTWLGKS